MEDLLGIMRFVSELQLEMDGVCKTHFDELDQAFFGISASVKEKITAEIEPQKQLPSSATPQQTKKRPKRLSSLVENDGDSLTNASEAASEVTQRQSVRVSNSRLLAVAQEEENDEINTTSNLMPPPPPPAVAASVDTSLSSGRPQRAAKLRSEKNLKEQPLNSKLRRPSESELVKIKVESEQRASQMHNFSVTKVTQGKTSVAPQVEAPATPAVAAATITPVSALPAEEKKTNENDVSTTNLRIMIKREKLSTNSTATTATLEATKSAIADETTQLSTTTASNTTDIPGKKGRKKKEAHRPIKVERFSELDKGSPVSSRTRGTRNSQEPQPQPAPRSSVYEDAVEGLPNATPTIANETVTITPAVASEVTFNVPPPNATMTLADATFQVETGGSEEKDQTMQTARDASFPEGTQNNSIMTEDESPHSVPIAQIKAPPLPKVPTSLKGLKMPARTHELFNPLLQSPVKMRVEAFENAAIAQNSMRPKRVKDVAMSGSNTTPIIGKLPAPTLGRFLTPTQSSNALPINSAQPKKAPMSASKAATLTKTATGTNLKSTNSTSSKTLTRENSGEDFRKGLHQLAEDRKKQRELKHLQAAQLREAKERERSERMAKLAKEREEKRIKKQQEKEKLEERKRQEMEELQRKVCQQEEADRLKKAKAKEQERELLQQMKAKQMMPPPPKLKYTFEMLHEDDSTDDEGKVSYKRPPVPTWSRSHVRGAAIVCQSFCPTDVIDSFFSVAPTTPDLKQIFPNIDPSFLKRNSSVLWSTPPRYSELPKY